MTVIRFPILSGFLGILQGTVRVGPRSLLLLGHAGASGVSASIMVSMDQVVVVPA
jgi:hypothetical protein